MVAHFNLLTLLGVVLMGPQVLSYSEVCFTEDDDTCAAQIGTELEGNKAKFILKSHEDVSDWTSDGTYGFQFRLDFDVSSETEVIANDNMDTIYCTSVYTGDAIVDAFSCIDA
jgi:hypothetical protein